MTLTLHWVILHTIVHHSSTSACTLNFTEIERTYCGRTDRRKYVRKKRTFETHFIRLTHKSRSNQHNTAVWIWTVFNILSMFLTLLN